MQKILLKRTEGRAIKIEATKKAQLIRLPARASIWYIATSALQRSIGVIGTPIFTRLLSAEEYGLTPLFNTWIGVISVIATLEISGGISLRGLQKYKDSKSEFVCSALGLIGCIFTVLCTVYLLFSDLINRLTGLSTSITVIMLFQILINSIINLYVQECKYDYNYKTVAVINILTALVTPLVAVMIILMTQFHAEARILAGFTVTLCLCIPILFYIVKNGKKLINIEIWRYLLRVALPLLPHYISVAIILRVGEIVIGRIQGTEALGKYSVALSLGMSLTVVTNGLTSAISPWLLRKISSENIPKIREMLLLSTKGLCLFCLIILSVIPETIKIITPKEYHECLAAVYPLALSSIPMFLSGVISQGQMYYEKSIISSLPSVTAAFVSTVLSLAVLPFVDYRYISVFVLVSYATLFVLNSFIFKKLSNESIIDFKRVASIYALCILYALLFLLLREHVIIRMILVIPIIPMLLRVGISVYGEIKET